MKMKSGAYESASSTGEFMAKKGKSSPGKMLKQKSSFETTKDTSQKTTIADHFKAGRKQKVSRMDAREQQAKIAKMEHCNYHKELVGDDGE